MGLIEAKLGSVMSSENLSYRAKLELSELDQDQKAPFRRGVRTPSDEDDRPRNNLPKTDIGWVKNVMHKPSDQKSRGRFE